jgi:hypothetical protein
VIPSLAALIWYVPPAKPLNTFDACQFMPPSIEYCNGAVPPVAVIVIEPSANTQSIGSVEDTFVIEGAFGAVNTTGLER